jgi:hypothetical protein
MLVPSTYLPSIAPLSLLAFLVTTVVVVLSSGTSEAAARYVFVVSMVLGFVVYGFWNIRKDVALQKDSTRVINENFFADVLAEGKSRAIQIVDDNLLVSGSLPSKLVYVIRDSKLVQVLTSLSSVLERNTFVELVGRMESFKRQYYKTLERYYDEVKKRVNATSFMRHDATADLQSIKQSILKYVHSLVHQLPPEKQERLFGIIDDLSTLMNDAITRLKRVYAYTQ